MTISFTLLMQWIWNKNTIMLGNLKILVLLFTRTFKSFFLSVRKKSVSAALFLSWSQKETLVDIWKEKNVLTKLPLLTENTPLLSRFENLTELRSTRISYQYVKGGLIWDSQKRLRFSMHGALFKQIIIKEWMAVFVEYVFSKYWHLTVCYSYNNQRLKFTQSRPKHSRNRKWTWFW